MISVNKNIAKINDYPFDRLRKLLSNLCPADKKKELNLSIGQPYHHFPNFINETLTSHKDKWHLYPPIIGIPELRLAYISWIKKRFQVNDLVYDNNILPLSGSREGLFSIALSLNINKIIIPNPFYQVYLGSSLFQQPAISLMIAEEKTNFLMDLKSLEIKLKKNKYCLVYFCSPTNPQGKIASFSYLEALIKLIRKYNAVLIIDECYIDIYTKIKPIGALQVCKSLNKGLDNVLIFHSLSKRSNVAGIRSGFVTGDTRIISIYKKLRSYSAPTIPIPLQFASAKLWEDETHVIKSRMLYKKKFDYADKIFSRYNSYVRPEAGFYLWMKVKNGENFTKKLYHQYRIKVMPGIYLSKGDKYNPAKNYIRVALVHNFKNCKIALDSIASLLKL